MVVLKAAQDRGAALPPEKRELLGKLTRASLKLKNELKPVQDRLAQMTASEEETRKHHQAKISVVGTMYPGVKVAIRNAKRNIVEEMRYVTLTERNSEIKTSSFK